jgi:histone H3/H4
MSEQQDPLYVKSKVREFLKTQEVNISGDLIDGQILNEKIMGLLKDAADRAKDNGRKTVFPRDL